MKEYNVNEILNTYNEEDQKEIVSAITFLSITNCYGAPTTKEDFKAFCNDTLRRRDEYKTKEKAKAEKKANNEKAKAKEMGLNVEQYKEYKKAIANAKRYEREKTNALEQIKELQRSIRYYERRANEERAKAEQYK